MFNLFNEGQILGESKRLFEEQAAKRSKEINTTIKDFDLKMTNFSNEFDKGCEEIEKSFGEIDDLFEDLLK